MKRCKTCERDVANILINGYGDCWSCQVQKDEEEKESKKCPKCTYPRFGKRRYCSFCKYDYYGYMQVGKENKE